MLRLLTMSRLWRQRAVGLGLAIRPSANGDKTAGFVEFTELQRRVYSETEMSRGLMILTSIGFCVSALSCNHTVGQQTQADATPPLPASVPSPALGSVVMSPCDFGGSLKGQEGVIIVPENRTAEASRPIAVHFFRFPARDPGNLPPVFFLPGGPGSTFDSRSINSYSQRLNQYTPLTEIREYNRKRDVILVNQRGNANGPDRHSRRLVWSAKAGPFRQPLQIEESSRRLAEGVKAAFDLWQSKGMDLAGYDILNLVDDVDDIRKAFGYEKIALRGSSFGSQWSLAYMKRWPQHVDRALLGGVEPLDHAYDSPQGIWNALERLEKRVIADGTVALPEAGLLGAVKAIVERFEKQPLVVKGRHPRRASFHNVPIGVDDFRHYLRRRGMARSLRQSLETWPKFVLEIYNEDYQYLASRIIDDRPEQSRGIMLLPLVDNSLGIGAAREEKLQNEPAQRWLGDINWFSVATRDVTPTPVVDDEFRRFAVSEIPVLMVQGDLDLSTPLENAQELLEYLPNGHLIRVNGGTHGAVGEIARTDPEFVKHLFLFMNSDFEKTDTRTLFEQLPNTVDLPPLEFKTLDGPSLFEELTGRK